MKVSRPSSTDQGNGRADPPDRNQHLQRLSEWLTVLKDICAARIEEPEQPLPRELIAQLDRLDAEQREVTRPMLDRIRSSFELSTFESLLLVLCAAYEIDGPTNQWLSRLPEQGLPPYPCMASAYHLLPHPHWDAISPQRPLRRWELVRFGEEGVLTNRPLRIDEQVLHLLMGLICLDPLREAQTHLPPRPQHTAAEVAEEQRAKREVIEHWGGRAASVAGRTLQLVGPIDQVAMVAVRSWAQLGVPAHLVSSRHIPADLAARQAFLRGWEREALLGVGSMVLHVEDELSPETADRLNWLIHHARFRLTLITSRVLTCLPQGILRINLQPPDHAVRRSWWLEQLESIDGTAITPGEIERIVFQFAFGKDEIAGVCDQFRHAVNAGAAGESTLLWECCVAAAEPDLGHLAQRLGSRDGWDELILPPRQKRMLEQIVSYTRQRARVAHDWKMVDDSRGESVTVLFTGESGTGKTMAAECLAFRLSLPIYRIDLSMIVSKYIGETEKNLSKVFDAAEKGGAILLFDEADALFGKRSEISSSNDRYANLETGYLLQRLESYGGLAILTTNHRDNIDSAFARRFRFVMHFPRPGRRERGSMWRRAFPAEVPRADFDFDVLATIDLTGAQIRNAALAAAAQAADSDQSVSLPHLRRAIEHELIKADQSVSLDVL